MRVTPTASEAPHALHLTSASKSASAADVRVGGAPAGSPPPPATGGARSYYGGGGTGGARSYYAGPPGKLDVRA